MRIYDGDADREVGGRESRVQMAKAPRAERTVRTGGEAGADREDRLLKGIRIVGRSDRKSSLPRCKIARELSYDRLDLSIKGARVTSRMIIVR